MGNKCLWCGGETEGETFLYCSYWHKLNHRHAVDNPITYLYPDTWEYDFSPLKPKEVLDE